MVTVSDVDVSRDLAVAKVFVTFLGARLETRAAVKRLGEFAPRLRQVLGRRMRMRIIPEIRFAYDDSLERGLHMDEVLRSLNKDGDL